MFPRTLPLAAVVLALIAGPLWAIDLVKDGKPIAKIVVAAERKPHPRLPKKGAEAREFNNLVKAVSGATLEIIQDNAPIPEDVPLVLLGDSAALRAAGVNLDNEKPETVIIKTVGNKLIVAGASPGEFHAIYMLFQRACGVRWLWPGEQGTVIPRSATISVGQLDIRETPAFQRRYIAFMYPKVDAQRGPKKTEARLWMRRNCGDGGSIALSSEHAYDFAVTYAEKDRPEWLPLVDGKRQMTGDAGHTHPCYSNPDFQRYVADHYIAKLRDTKQGLMKAYGWTAEQAGAYMRGNSGLSLSQQDGDKWCECERCRALDEPENHDKDGKLVCLSDRMVKCASAISSMVRAVEPDARFGFYAYGRTKSPPVRAIPDPGLVTDLTDFVENNPKIGVMTPGKVEFLKEYTRRYGAIFCRVSIGDYKGNPTFYPHRMAEYLRMFRDNGLVGVTGADIRNEWGEQGLKVYHFTHLLWNPDLNVDELTRDFCLHAFGEKAAPAMIEYFNAMEQATVTVSEEYSVRDMDKAWAMLYREECVKAMGAPLLKAEAADATPEQKARLAEVRKAFDRIAQMSAEARARVGNASATPKAAPAAAPAKPAAQEGLFPAEE